MAESGEGIAGIIEQQCAELGAFLGTLNQADLRLTCADPAAATVGAVLSHLSEGYDLVLRWLAHVTGGQALDSAGIPGELGGPAPDHELVDLGAETDRLRLGGQALATMVRGLTGQQLGQVPAETKDITDGTLLLSEIIERMIEHQSIHLGYVRSAMAGLAQSSERAS
jgi:hypothetical protein